MSYSKLERVEMANWFMHRRPLNEVTVQLVSVSTSGMSREFRVIQNKRDVTRQVAVLLNKTYNEDTRAIRVKGNGMDMSFALINAINNAVICLLELDKTTLVINKSYVVMDSENYKVENLIDKKK